MNIDITKLVTDKIQSLKEDRTIENQIEKSVESTVLGAITSVLESWEFKRNIEEQVSKSISDVASQIGLSAYNGFICEKIKDITENVMRADIAEKIQKTFDEMLIIKHDGIKLSEIFDKYREWLFENTDESDKWERRNFTCEFEDEENGDFHYYKIKLSEEKVSSYQDVDIEIRICTYGEKEKANIYSLHFSGERLDGTLKLGSLNPIETLLANLYYNKTEIILDIDDIDDSDYYDIDC